MKSLIYSERTAMKSLIYSESTAVTLIDVDWCITDTKLHDSFFDPSWVDCYLS